MTILNASAILSRVCSVLSEYKVHFKYSVDLAALQQLNSGHLGYSQIGKSLVIYAESSLLPIAAALRGCLWPFRGQSPRVPYARRIAEDDLPIYYRYGAYRGTTIRIGASECADVRSRHDLAVPAAIEDPFEDAGARDAPPTSPAPPVRAFLRRFPATKALVQRGKGGVFRGLDLQSPRFREVIIRFGYPAGEVQPDGTDGVALVRREQRFFRELAARGLLDIAPGWVADHEDTQLAVLVTEFLAGDNLLALLQEGRLTVKLAQAGLSLIGRLHEAGLFWGDAKLANLIVTGDGAVRAMDFETGGRIGEDTLLQMRTFSWPGDVARDPRAFDIAHYLVSVLYPYEDAAAGQVHLHRVDLAELLARPRDRPPQTWAATQLTALLDGRLLAEQRADTRRNGTRR